MIIKLQARPHRHQTAQNTASLVGFVGKIKNNYIVHVPEQVRDKDRERDHRYGCSLKSCRDQAHTIASLGGAEEHLNPYAVGVILVCDLFIRLQMTRNVLIIFLSVIA